VLGGRGPNRERADARLRALVELQDPREPAAAQEPRGAGRDHDGHLPAEAAERPDVEMVVVQVGDQYGVELPERGEIGAAGDAHQERDPRPKHWVGQQSHAVELDQHCAVADPGHAQLRLHRSP
jgi:hypothetical protein